MDTSDLPEIVDYEESGYDSSTGSAYNIKVYLLEIHPDDNPYMTVNFICRFLEFGSPISHQPELSKTFSINKDTFPEFCHVVQFFSDIRDMPVPAGGNTVRIATRDLLFACPRAKSVVAITTVDFIGWDYVSPQPPPPPPVDRGLVARVAAEVIANMQAGGGWPADRGAVERLERVVIGDLDGTTTSCVVCLEEFEVGGEATRMPCGHVFDPDCIVMWLQNRRDCPVCRFQLPWEIS